MSRIITSALEGSARDAGEMMGRFAFTNQNAARSTAYIFGGETTVHVKGTGLGGRNQEIALAAAEKLALCENTCIFSVGSDGTDGPTDAAGGFVTDRTAAQLAEQGIAIFDVLQNNDAYNALKACDGLIMTGATGTNVNDVAVLLIDR